MHCLQEEIAHCAAGVRWLTYLHKQACADSPQQASPATAAALQSLQGATPNDNATSEASGQVEADMTSKTQSQTDAAQPLYTEASKKQDTSGSHAWQQHARQYATVETWFHALVKAHFKGSLKVRSIVQQSSISRSAASAKHNLDLRFAMHCSCLRCCIFVASNTTPLCCAATVQW